MDGISDHPQRYELTNELHARPFPELTAPCRALHLAIMSETEDERDPEADRAHLLALIERHGAQHPAPGANHYSGQLGAGWLKWERHTEFVTYTLFQQGVADQPFSGNMLQFFPSEWLDSLHGRILTSALVRIETVPDLETADNKLQRYRDTVFVSESLAAARVVDDNVIIAGDFRIHDQGQMRFSVMAMPECGPRRLGRIVQRVLEIETYRAGSLLALPVARDVANKVRDAEKVVSTLVSQMSSEEREGHDAAELDQLLKLSAEIERLSVSTAFRFGARGAYHAIVDQRLEVLRQERLSGFQTFSEFMMRRYDPAMRTCISAQDRLKSIAERTGRAANMLRTRVDVQQADQNRALLESMNKRAELQLRLQETVEGLSVVAISYYAVSLVTYALVPFGKMLGIDKVWLTAGATPIVAVAVWLFLARMKKRLHK